MKRMKLVLSLLAIVAVVGSALAFKSSTYFGAGNLFCGPAILTPSTCETEDPIDFAYVGSNSGTTTDPCPGTDVAYRIVFNPTTEEFECQLVPAGNFVPTSLSK